MYWDIYERRKIDNIRYFDPERAIASYKNYFKKYDIFGNLKEK